jgi:hypothetical protein
MRSKVGLEQVWYTDNRQTYVLAYGIYSHVHCVVRGCVCFQKKIVDLHPIDARIETL